MPYDFQIDPIKFARFTALRQLIRSYSSLGDVDRILIGAARRMRAIPSPANGDSAAELDRCAMIVEAMVGSGIPMAELMDAMRSAMVDWAEAE